MIRFTKLVINELLNGIFTKLLENNGFSELKWSKKHAASISDTDTIQEDNGGICNIISNKKSSKGSFNNKKTLSIGTMVRWRHTNSDGKIISTTHKIIRKKSSHIFITKSSEIEDIFKLLSLIESFKFF